MFFTCPGIHRTMSGHSDFFVLLKLSDGPGVGGKWLYEGVPGAMSLGFDGAECDCRDGV